MNDFRFFLLFMFAMAFMAMVFEVNYDKPCTFPTAPVGTLSWATSTNTH